MKWFWGPIAIRTLRLHYAREVRRHAEKKGESREHVRAAAHRALDRLFNEAWPSDTPEAKSPVECEKRKDDHFTSCCICGADVDMREVDEGGDKDGSEPRDGRWACSSQCRDAAQGE